MIKQEKIIWQPNKGAQTEVLTRIEDEILYGGSRGGGKTDAGMAWLLRWIGESKYRFLVIRRNSKDLDDWIDRAKIMWAGTGADFVQGEVRFPSGALGRFGHLHDDDAYEKYQGHEYQKMVIEELTHIPTEELYQKLTTSCRSTVEGLKPQIFCTTNPGNAGHLWVKNRFIDCAKAGERYISPNGNTRIFIPARVYDNPVLMERDPGYIKRLMELDEPTRKAWLDGDWTIQEVKGAYYARNIEDARKNGRIGGVPHDVNALVHTWWDLGMRDSTTIGFFQNVGQEWHLINAYEAQGEGLAHYARYLDDLRRLEGYHFGRHFAPHDIRARELGSGKSRIETASSLGIDFEIVPNLLVDDGINAVRGRFNSLWIDKHKCDKFLNALANYRKEWSDKANTYGDKPVHDWTSHFADMLRYWAVTDFRDERNRTAEPEIRTKFDPFAIA